MQTSRLTFYERPRMHDHDGPSISVWMATATLPSFSALTGSLFDKNGKMVNGPAYMNLPPAEEAPTY